MLKTGLEMNSDSRSFLPCETSSEYVWTCWLSWLGLRCAHLWTLTVSSSPFVRRAARRAQTCMTMACCCPAASTSSEAWSLYAARWLRKATTSTPLTQRKTTLTSGGVEQTLTTQMAGKVAFVWLTERLNHLLLQSLDTVNDLSVSCWKDPFSHLLYLHLTLKWCSDYCTIFDVSVIDELSWINLTAIFYCQEYWSNPTNSHLLGVLPGSS